MYYYILQNGTQYTQKFKATYSKSHTRHSTDAVRTGVVEEMWTTDDCASFSRENAQYYKKYVH